MINPVCLRNGQSLVTVKPDGLVTGAESSWFPQPSSGLWVRTLHNHRLLTHISQHLLKPNNSFKSAWSTNALLSVCCTCTGPILRSSKVTRVVCSEEWRGLDYFLSLLEACWWNRHLGTRTQSSLSLVDTKHLQPGEKRDSRSHVHNSRNSLIRATL